MTHIFRSTDNAYTSRSGQPCSILRPLTADEFDLLEVGPMFRIEFADGFQADAFEDELTPIQQPQQP